MDLLYCECTKLASPYCNNLKCMTCCNDSNCKKHKNKKSKKSKKSKKKINNNQEYIFNNRNNKWINSEYSFEMLNKIKLTLNNGIKKLVPELTNYIVDFIDNRIKCPVCNIKRKEEDLFPCFYCKKLVCDDTCNEIKDGEYQSLVYYCLQCKEDGIVSEDESFINFDLTNNNFDNDYEDKDEDDITVLSFNSDITEYNIDLTELADKNIKCSCGKDARYLLRNINKIPRCWNCNNIVWYNKENHYIYVCKINCNYGIYVDNVNKKNGKILIESMCDKDECSHCGRRNITVYEYEAIKFNDIEHIDNKEKCKCGKNIRYYLKNKNKINCEDCGHLFFDDYIHNICSTKCNYNHEWTINEYLSKKKKKNVIFNFIKKNHVCSHCNLKQDLIETFIGEKVKNEEDYENY